MAVVRTFSSSTHCLVAGTQTRSIQREGERERVRVHRKALSLQGKRASLLVEAILMSGSMLMWGVIVPTAVGHVWYQG